jgi:hypothetical protein
MLVGIWREPTTGTQLNRDVVEVIESFVIPLADFQGVVGVALSEYV